MFRDHCRVSILNLSLDPRLRIERQARQKHAKLDSISRCIEKSERRIHGGRSEKVIHDFYSDRNSYLNRISFKRAMLSMIYNGKFEFDNFRSISEIQYIYAICFHIKLQFFI